MSKTATLVRRLPGWRGDAGLYKLSEPLEDNEHVIVSAIDLSIRFPNDHTPASMMIETYIFAADENANVTDWAGLPGSQKGTLDHAEALRDAGYEVAA